MKSRTFGLFLISGSLLLGTILIATFWDALGLGENKVGLAVTTTMAFGISVAGLIVGFSELKKLKASKFWIGFIGHFIVVGVFLLTVIYGLDFMKLTIC